MAELFVNDVNDNYPTFVNLPYRAEVLEVNMLTSDLLADFFLNFFSNN